VNKTGISKRLH